MPVTRRAATIRGWWCCPPWESASSQMRRKVSLWCRRCRVRQTGTWRAECSPQAAPPTGLTATLTGPPQNNNTTQQSNTETTGFWVIFFSWIKKQIWTLCQACCNSDATRWIQEQGIAFWQHLNIIYICHPSINAVSPWRPQRMFEY